MLDRCPRKVVVRVERSSPLQAERLPLGGGRNPHVFTSGHQGERVRAVTVQRGAGPRTVGGGNGTRVEAGSRIGVLVDAAVMGVRTNGATETRGMGVPVGGPKPEDPASGTGPRNAGGKTPISMNSPR
jgi:hypothetical protein